MSGNKFGNDKFDVNPEFSECGDMTTTESKAEKIIAKINEADEVEIMEFDFDECFTYLRELETLKAKSISREAVVVERINDARNIAYQDRANLSNNDLDTLYDTLTSVIDLLASDDKDSEL